MSATVAAIQDRLHAINGAIDGVKARRTFPQRLDPAGLPALIALPGAAERYTARIGTGGDQQTRLFRLLLIVTAWAAGVPTESAQRKTEALIDAVADVYQCRPRLELDGAPLEGVVSAELLEDSGITVLGDHAAVEFLLAVTYVG